MGGKYVVIGGQYMQRYYGITNTLRGAKRLASRNLEYWDNWQGFHVPKVYAIEDCTEDGDQMFVHSWIQPVSVGSYHKGRIKWTDSYEIPLF